MRVFESRKLLPMSLLLLVITLAVNGATKGTAVVKDLSLNPNGDSLEVRIATSEKAQYTYFELSNPHRLVVDFHDIQNAIGYKEKSIQTAGVERVRTSLFTDKNRKATRIVFDLAENVPYKVTDDGEKTVRVVFGRNEQPKAPLSLIAGPPIIPESGKKPLPSVSVPVTPVQLPVLRAQVTPQAAAPMTTTVPPKTLPASLQASQTPGQFTGELTSFDFKDLDIKDFFRVIGNISGLNIVLDPAVSGTVTIMVTDVPWDQALDIVLKNNQLGSELEGNVLRIATRATLQAEQTSRKTLKDAQNLAADLETHSYILNYTKAADVTTTLLKPGVLTARGTIISDVRRNALIVSDVPAQFGKVDQLVQFLDTPAQQVEIEARLLSANKSFSRELGSQLGFLLGNAKQGTITGAGSVGASPFPRTGTPPAVNIGNAIPLSVNLPAAGTSGISFLLGSGADQILDEIITAAEARGTAKIISRPKVMAQNNVPAVISQGTQIPVQTSQNNTVSVQFISFSLKLSVTPQITDAGTILLTANIENSQPDFAKAVNGIPSVATQQASTQVLIEDGGTAVIGGILVDQDTYNLQQVPGLGSIPLIGHLFKNSSVIKSTAELLFFITGRIQPRGALTLPPTQEKPPGPQR